MMMEYGEVREDWLKNKFFRSCRWWRRWRWLPLGLRSEFTVKVLRKTM